jgi:type I restriction enzyme S subunit
VDFEFPNEDGKPYKSSGGTMVYNNELDMEIPAIWNTDLIGNIVICNSNTYNKNDKFKNIKYLDTSNIANNKIDELKLLDINIDVIPSRAKRKVKHNSIIYSTVRPNLSHYGILKNPPNNMIVSTGFAVLDINNHNLFAEYVYMYLISKERINYFQSKAEMSVSTYPSIKPEDLLETTIIVPTDNILKKAKLLLEPLFDKQLKTYEINKVLKIMKDILLSKMSTIEDKL